MKDLLTRRHFITFFDDEYARKKYEDEITLNELADEIRQFSGPSKAELPFLKLAQFGDIPSKKKCLRYDKNTLAISGIEIDYDTGTMPFDAAIEAMRSAGLRCLIYTSASYVRGVKEKWRVLAPTSTLLAPLRRKELMASVNAALGGVAAYESQTLSQAFYYGFIRGQDGHRVEVLDGDFIDQRPDLLAKTIYPARPAQVRPDREPVSGGVTPGRDDAEIAALLAQSRQVNKHGEKQWHNSMLSAVASMVSKRWSNAEIFEACAPYCDGGHGDDDIAVMIEGARTKWQLPDPAGVFSAGLMDAVAAARGAGGTGLARTEPNWRERYVETQRPKASYHNAILAIGALHIHCSKDTFHNQLWMGRSDASAPREMPMPFLGLITDGSIALLRRQLSDTFGLDFTEKHVRDAVNTLCEANKFDPVVDLLADAQANWDGQARLDRMAADYFNAEDTALNRQMVRKTMIAAVARARQPGCKFDTILTMESREGWNKSSAWAVLAGEGNFSDASILGHGGREVQEQLANVWIHENPELAGMRKAEAEMVKAFASRQVDRARPAYGHYLVEQPRHSIEVATTNSEQYLQSLTGNRRFWPIGITAPIDLGKLRGARLQLWGEAAYYQSQGETLTLDEALWAAAGVEQEARRVRHPWEAKIDSMMVAAAGSLRGGLAVIYRYCEGEDRVHTMDIFDQVIGLRGQRLHRGDAMTLQEIMQQRGWTHNPISELKTCKALDTSEKLEKRYHNA